VDQHFACCKGFSAAKNIYISLGFNPNFDQYMPSLCWLFLLSHFKS